MISCHAALSTGEMPVSNVYWRSFNRFEAGTFAMLRMLLYYTITVVNISRTIKT